MSRRSEMIRDRRIRFFLWGSICVIIVLAYFCFHPWIWRTDSHQTAGSSVILDTTSDFLLVVDYAAFTSAPDQYAETSFKVCEPTAYAKSCGLYGGSWWTRTPSDYLRDQSFVGSDGYLWNVGTCQWYYGWDDFFGVRPAMYIRVE